MPIGRNFASAGLKPGPPKGHENSARGAKKFRISSTEAKESTARTFSVAASPRCALSGETRNARPLEDCKLHVQEFFRVLPEISNQQTHVSRQTRHVVVEFRVAEKRSCSRL